MEKVYILCTKRRREKSGIFAIGEKSYKDEDIEYLCVGQSNNMKD